VNPRIFISTDQKLINLRYEIKEFWNDISKKSHQDNTELQEIAGELLSRTYKQYNISDQDSKHAKLTLSLEEKQKDSILSENYLL
jgi:hypothetical protein